MPVHRENRTRRSAGATTVFRLAYLAVLSVASLLMMGYFSCVNQGN
jgi:hypothetical protein